MSMKEKPMLIFTSCTECGACKQFRGPDGRPRDNQPWNAKFIRDKLTNNGKLNALRIINIHDSEFGASISHINEFTLYHMIPPDVVVSDNFFTLLMDNPNMYYGLSILRIKIERSVDDTINFLVEIDGNETDDRCELIRKQVEDYFLWSFVPNEFNRLRNFFRKNSTEDISHILYDLRDDPFHDTLIMEYNKFVVNPDYFDNQIRIRFGFSWFINFFYPERFRELESFYPSWIMVLPSEWCKGISDQDSVREAQIYGKEIPKMRPIYGKVISCKTYMDGSRFRSVKFSVENINDCLKQYYDGRLFLTYEEVLLNNGQSIPDFKRFVNKETGKVYNVIGETSPRDHGKITSVNLANHNNKSNTLGRFPISK